MADDREYRRKRNAATNKRIAKNYDRAQVLMYRGQLDMVKAHAAEGGENVSGLINRLLADEIPGFRPMRKATDQAPEEQTEETTD